MKKYLLTAAALIICSTFSPAQTAPKLGYVDSQVILNQFSEAVKAQGDLDALTKRWSDTLDSMTVSYQQGMADYQKNVNNMPEDRKLSLQKDLIAKEQAILDFRRQKFAQNTGEIYQAQEQIFNPVKTKIYKAIETVAKEEGMQFVFDKSGDIILLYADSSFDITYKVLDRLKRGI